MAVDEVTIVAPFDGRTWNGIASGFERAGAKVHTVDITDCRYDAYKCELKISPFLNNSIVLCAREYGLVALTPKLLSGSSVLIVWNVDTYPTIEHDKVPILWPLFQKADIYYSVDAKHLETWRSIGVFAFWLPTALQDQLYKPPEEIPAEARARYECDVCFAGSEAPLHIDPDWNTIPRNDLIDMLLTLSCDVKLWGCRGRPGVWNEQHNYAVSCSKINIAHNLPGRKYVSERLYQILGAKGFVLMNSHEAAEEWLPLRKGEEGLVLFDSLDDCKEKIYYYLSHEDERQRIAERGYQWCLQNTYVHRAKAILAHVQRHLADEPVGPEEVPYLVQPCREADRSR